MDNSNNGLITKVWGGPSWITNHSITFGYPVHPTDEDKNNYRNYFLSLGNVLPCRYCRESYNRFIREGDTALTDADLQSRETLTKWFYRLHETVNKKLETDYYVTYDDVVEKYESFRAKCGPPKPNDIATGCITPLHLKAFSYQKLNQKDCPVVPLELIEPFVRIARLRNFEKHKFSFYEIAKQYDGDVYALKKLPVWKERNMYCQHLIETMRENAVPSIEENGVWEGSPTNQELDLLLLMCSNFDKKQLQNVIRNVSKNCIYFDSCQEVF